MNEACAQCRFWDVTNQITIGSRTVKVAACRRHPPTRERTPNLFGKTPVVETVWPETRADDWCGHFEPRAQVTQ